MPVYADAQQLLNRKEHQFLGFPVGSLSYASTRVHTTAPHVIKLIS